MKPYQPPITNKPNVIRYAVMNFAITCAAASMLFGKLALHVSADRIYLLTVLYNTIAITGQGLVALFADRVRNKHTGVRLGTLLFALGFLWPMAFGVTPKVVLAAVGTCLFTAFSASSILARSEGRVRDMGIYLSGAPIGLAFATYAPLFGYFALPLLMAFATPSDRAEALPNLAENDKKTTPKAPLSLLFVSIFTLLSGMGGYLFASLHFAWDTWFRTAILLLLATAVGRALGGILSDVVGSATVLIGGIGGGTALLLTCADNKLLSLVGIALLSMAAAPFTTTSLHYLPRHPAFLFSLLGGASYFGYLASKVYPYKASLLPIVGATTLLATLAAKIVLFRQKRKETTPHA